MDEGDSRIPWKRLLFTAFLPNLLYNVGQGAIIPIVPQYTVQLGSSLAFAAFVLAMLTMGQLAGSLIGGHLATRIGERRTMQVAAAVGAAGGAVGATAATAAVLAVGCLLIGAAASALALARHSYVTTAVDPSYRGRTMSVLAGFSRIGLLLGPFCTAALISAGGPLRSAFVIMLAAAAAVGLLAIATRGELDRTSSREPSRTNVLHTLREHRAVLLTVGVGAALLQSVRAGRQILVPIWGVAIGLSATDIALVVGFSALLDVALFYSGGILMDRYGRLSVALPAFAAFGIAHLVMALLDELPDPAVWLVGMSLVMAVANGLTSGLNITMASDLADRRDPAAFLGAWRFVTDAGAAVAPLLIAAVATVSLAAASLVMAGGAVLGGGLMARFVPRFLPPRDR